MATIITKNSSTASSVPAAGSLQQGELAVNVTDKKLYTKDSTAAVVKLVGSLGNQEANAVAITGGTINGTAIGGIAPSTGAFTTVSASGGFTGNLTGNASTVTNGVYTTGSYADPAWITSLAGSKITGNISGNAANVTGVVAIANGGTGLTALGTGVQTALGQAVTGSGGIVLANSPSLVTPNLGTPSAVTLTNATGLPVATGISGLGTNVATALGVSVGSVGSVVVNGGALGTPSSGTVTNLTGTASININGTVGATTPNTGSFTTLTTSSTVTINAGTANGVAYLNASKVLTTGSALTFDGTNLSVGGTAPSNAGYTNLYLNNTSGAQLFLSVNGSNTRVLYSTATSLNYYTSDASPHVWQISGAEQARLTSTGLGIGTSSPTRKLQVYDTTSGYQFRLGFSNLYYYDIGRSSVDGYFDFYGNQSGNIGYRFGGADGTRLTIDSSGNLGLGVTPSAWGASKFAFQLGARASLYGANNLTVLGNNYYADAADNRYIATAAASDYYQSAGSHVWRTAASGTAGNIISFTQAMTLDASGRLGIGLTNPSRTLDVYGSGQFKDASGIASTIWSEAVTGAGGVGTNSNHPFAFLTNGSERARITSGGDLLVGTTTSSGKVTVTNGSATQYLGVWRSDRATTQFFHAFNYNGTEIGTITGNNTSTAYNTTSDYRLKDNPQPLTGSGSFIDALKPKTWAWKSDGSKGVGFIAHEVQEVSPSSVVGEKDGEKMQVMEYGSAEFIANIIAELQSLRARVAQLEAK